MPALESMAAIPPPGFGGVGGAGRGPGGMAAMERGGSGEFGWD